MNVIARMFSEYPATRSALLRVVATVASDRCLREDLLQEALIHLWRLGSFRPEQSPSWYFKSCHLHLLNLLRKGRSVDAVKRRKGRISLPDADSNGPGDDADLDALLGAAPPAGSVVAQVCFRDMLASMYRWLDPPDRVILDLLVDGMSAREVAGRLRVSHTAVIKRQRKIASVAISLGLAPSSRARVRAQKQVSTFAGELLLKR